MTTSGFSNPALANAVTTSRSAELASTATPRVCGAVRSPYWSYGARGGPGSGAEPAEFGRDRPRPRERTGGQRMQGARGTVPGQEGQRGDNGRRRQHRVKVDHRQRGPSDGQRVGRHQRERVAGFQRTGWQADTEPGERRHVAGAKGVEPADGGQPIGVEGVHQCGRRGRAQAAATGGELLDPDRRHRSDLVCRQRGPGRGGVAVQQRVARSSLVFRT